MVRQARSEATRRKIINAAVDLFSEVGYSAAGLGEIVARAELTKGALYFHFDSKESLASAIIEEGDATVFNAFRGIDEWSSPALERMIHGSFVITDLVADDKIARTARQLSRTLGEFSGSTARSYGRWLAAMTALTRQASAEGDLRETLDPDGLGELVVGALLGAEQISYATFADDDGHLQRLVRTWELLLPTIVADESLPYFREYLAREALRHVQPPLSME